MLALQAFLALGLLHSTTSLSTWLCGDYGAYLECHSGSVATGRCASGSYHDCGSTNGCGSATNHAVHCTDAADVGVSLKVDTDYFWQCTGYGSDNECMSDQVVTGACASGMNANCAKTGIKNPTATCSGDSNYYDAIDCHSTQETIGDCVWTNHGYGEYYVCPSSHPVMAGECTVATHATCEPPGTSSSDFFSTKCCAVSSGDQSDSIFPATDAKWQPATGMSTVLQTKPLNPATSTKDEAGCKTLCENDGLCNVITFDTQNSSCKFYNSLDSMIESPKKTATTYYIDGSVDTHYGDPQSGSGCLAEEMIYEVANIPDALFCSAECGDDGWCPQDRPSGVKKGGECLLNDPVGTSRHCAIPCKEEGDCGSEMSCNLEYDQGICAYSFFSYDLERPLPEFTNQDVKDMYGSNMLALLLEETPTV